MRKKYNKTKLRAAFLSLLTIALLAATATFMGTSAAEAVVSNSDVSITDDVFTDFEGKDLPDKDLLDKIKDKGLLDDILDDIKDSIGDNLDSETEEKKDGKDTQSKDIQSVDFPGPFYVYPGYDVELPEFITATFTDGTIGEVPITWTEPDGSPVDAKKHSGMFFVNGHVNNYPRILAVRVMIMTGIPVPYWDEEIFGPLQITLTKSEESSNGSISFKLNDIDGKVYVDLGDSIPVEIDTSEQITKYAKDRTIKIYSKAPITEITCSTNALSSLDISNCESLTEIACYANNLTSLDISNCKYLTRLECWWNNLSELDVSKNTNLTYLDCAYNNLSELDISNNLELVYLDCGDNNLSVLDISRNVKLKWLDCGLNNLPELDISNNIELAFLGCSNNNLSQLEVSHLNMLNSLACGYNNLSALDVSKNTELEILGCSGNQLTELDVSNNIKLSELYCYYNQLSELDVSKNPLLYIFDCGNNNLSELEISSNKDLWYLICNNNNISKLDVSGHHNMVLLHCGDNSLKFSTVKLNEYLEGLLDGTANLSNPSNWIDGEISNDLQICDNGATIAYTPQAIISIPKTIYAGETVSQISSEFKVDGINTVYTWYEYDEAQGEISTASLVEVTPTKSEKGVFTFGEEFVGKKLYCTMTNDVLPYLTLQTTVVEVVANDNPTAEPDTDEPTDPTPPADTPGGTTNTENGPGTGESIALTIVASCLALLSLAAIGAVVYRKKFARSAK
ncbi:MAG: Ig-like domain-containing protein [Firmicutes bacterium]|nr:Ig-like domain-containing protein [Bacillota bacterium]